MNTYVSFPIAKLLKEKGLSNQCLHFYTNPRCKMLGIDEQGRYYPIKNKAKNLWISGYAATLDSKHVYYAPTIADVVMWLYEKHAIWIVVNVDKPHLSKSCMFFANVIKFGQHHKNKYRTIFYNSPTEAYEAAIEYTLNNLI